MDKKFTSWTAMAQSDIETAELIASTLQSGFNFELFNTGDSLWIVAVWPDKTRTAFRIAFALNGHFENVVVTDRKGLLQIRANTRLGKYNSEVSFPEKKGHLVRYTTTFEADFSFCIPFWPRDIVPLTKTGSFENTSAKIHTSQIGTRSGLIYFSLTRPKTGSVFYFQNLSALSDYCEATQTSIGETVGGEWPEIGFQLPVSQENPLPAGKKVVLTDAFVLLSETVPVSEPEITQSFIENLANVYIHLPKPDTEYHDWLSLSQKAMDDLQHNKGCWTQADGIPYLNAYLCDYKTPPEIMVQLSVLLPLKEFSDWKKIKPELYNELKCTLPEFYDDRIKSIVRWLPALSEELDNSEEQKKEMVMDSWYLHHPLMNLARLALAGDKISKKLLLKSVDFAVKVARHFKYEWPVFYKMDTLEVIRKETEPGRGGERDVAGSYVHLMLLVWKLTDNPLYFREAEKAARKLEGLGFDIFYQANNTAFAATALLELFKLTGKQNYLESSFACLAGLFKNVRLAECNYGNTKHYPNFFTVFPLNEAPYSAAYEEVEVYAALYDYVLSSEGITMPSGLLLLLSEFIKYSLSRMPYYYPPMLPRDILSDEVRTGELQHSLWIPLEDLNDGWEKAGQVGQEVYGAGLPFAVVSRQYYRLEEEDLLFFVDYPVKGFRKISNSLHFHTLGSSLMPCHVYIIGHREHKVSTHTDTIASKSIAPGLMQYAITGNSKVKISW
ncbi:MAG: hypothetical protein BGO88_00115 [Flavobacterium sp. 38-13]|uniref:hypothetical protein n=1 Tax=Flavobacterium sp. 38-13 TaxID=1896168 RepID=UPI0009654A6B|nr:hypothetical protein [Flavobacterium sp. 38-13]OJX48847.1 MAG: hypothetical protein BGO88_00115 [Flavobacterium sp. 38-13]